MRVVGVLFGVGIGNYLALCVGLLVQTMLNLVETRNAVQCTVAVQRRARRESEKLDQADRERNLKKARAVRKEKRTGIQNEVRRELEEVTPKWKALIAAHQRAMFVYGDDSQEAREADRELKPVEMRWIEVAMRADKLGVRMPRS